MSWQRPGKRSRQLTDMQSGQRLGRLKAKETKLAVYVRKDTNRGKRHSAPNKGSSQEEQSTDRSEREYIFHWMNDAPCDSTSATRGAG